MARQACEYSVLLLTGADVLQYCPLARHATLPELQALLDLFRPQSLSPNTLLPSLKGADYYAMVAAFGDCLALGRKEDLRKSCLDWFKREKGLATEAAVWAFAREVLLFPGGGADEMDLRPGRSANRQRQSDAFLPMLPVATKGTLSSPRADWIPSAPPIVVSPSAAGGVFGRMDAVREDEQDDSEEEQDTQVQKSREISLCPARKNSTRRPAEEVATLYSDRVGVTTTPPKASGEKGRFIIYPASPRSERLLKRKMTNNWEPTKVPLNIPPTTNELYDTPTESDDRKHLRVPERSKPMPHTPPRSTSAKKSGNGR
jgi:hypothetical protein